MKVTDPGDSLLKETFAGRLGYTTVWEDERIIDEGLAPQPGERVLSITSGGDFSLQCLLSDAGVLSLDFDPCQSYVLEYKKAAIAKLDYDEMWEVLGLKPSKRRLSLYSRLREGMTGAACSFWDQKTSIIDDGMLRYGRQDRYFHMVGRIIRVLQGKKLISNLFSSRDLKSQQAIFEQSWKNWRWNVFSTILFSRRTLNFFFHKDHFRFAQSECHPAHIFKRQAQRMLRDIPIQDNFYLYWLFFRTYRDEEHCPAWLRRSNFETLKRNIDNLTTTIGAFEQDITAAPDNFFDCYNCSNIFDWMDQNSFAKSMAQIVRTARPRARLCYWTNAVNTRRELSSVASELPRIRENKDLAANLFERCRTPGYSSCTIASIT